MIPTRFCPVCGAANESTHTHCFACGQSLLTETESAETRSGTLLLERYQLGTLLGAGGFSLVYRARDTQVDNRDVAIKQINLHGLSTEETIEATDTFNREVNLLSVLHHPQIPQLHDYFHDREHWYLVLEYLEGTTLEVYLEMRVAQGKPMRIDETLAMGIQLCTVLEYLHTRHPPVIFRDLKPGNIIRTPGGKLCLIDFGIARHFRPGKAHDTQRLGSPGYAAPEQYGRAQTTPQADIYSLGALLHGLLSGQDPSTQPRGLAPLHLAGYAGEAELVALVQQMLASDPAERPAQASDVVASLKRIQQNYSIYSETDRIWVPPIPQPRVITEENQNQMHVMLHAPYTQNASPVVNPRVNRRNMLIGLGTLVLLLTGGEMLWQATRLQPAPVPIPQPGPVGSTDDLYTYRGHTDAVWNAAWSPRGLRIASCSLDQTVQVWDALSGQDGFTYDGHTSGVMDTAWSPYGQRIASASQDKTVQVWDANDGDNALVYQGHTDTVMEANWSPDAKLLASCSLDGTVQVWDAITGNTLLTYLNHTGEVYAVKWSPDGTLIASSAEDHTVQIWHALTGSQLFTYRGHQGPVYEVAWSPDGKRVASASVDGTAQVWNVIDGSNSVVYRGHQDSVLSVAWSPDGTQVASSSSDTTVQLWNSTDGSHVFTYTGHTQAVIEVQWSPEGSLIASASEDNTVQIWSAP